MKNDYYKNLLYNFKLSGLENTYRYEDDELKNTPVFFSIKPKTGIINPIESYTDPKTGFVYHKRVIRK